MGDYILAQDEQFTKFFFGLSIKQKLLYAYTETTQNGEKSTESVYNSVNNNTNFKKFQILSIYTIWNRLSLKTISRYCPFKDDVQQHYYMVCNVKNVFVIGVSLYVPISRRISFIYKNITFRVGRVFLIAKQCVRFFLHFMRLAKVIK